MNGVHYVNTGDWVESLTAVVEHQDGRLEVIAWTEREAELKARAAAMWEAPPCSRPRPPLARQSRGLTP